MGCARQIADGWAQIAVHFTQQLFSLPYRFAGLLNIGDLPLFVEPRVGLQNPGSLVMGGVGRFKDLVEISQGFFQSRRILALALQVSDAFGEFLRSRLRPGQAFGLGIGRLQLALVGFFQALDLTSRRFLPA